MFELFEGLSVNNENPLILQDSAISADGGDNDIRTDQAGKRTSILFYKYISELLALGNISIKTPNFVSFLFLQLQCLMDKTPRN